MLPREVIACEDGQPLYKFSTSSPLRSTVGKLEKMALYAGESAALVDRDMSAAEAIERVMKDAVEASNRIRAAGG
jgi:nitronate monooxygenase